ncbi:hypothetical protein Y032_0720g1819 [Ancylostoma ceylanicum]|uniref:Uncharacterized protein n=1 Tax=Ancylostoma ceylanicum TaxID=53326 RepID=A0A016WGI1_9BILA|nr:hypothetical protein Y032_0720g1819 [Ancylostoma ceylanicum]
MFTLGNLNTASRPKSSGIILLNYPIKIHQFAKLCPFTTKTTTLLPVTAFIHIHTCTIVLVFERRRLFADGRRSLRDRRPVSHKPSAAAITADRPDERRRFDRRRSPDAVLAVSSSVDKSVRDPLVARDCECARAAAASCTDRR